MPTNLVYGLLITLETKLFGVLCFKTFALSLRSRRQHKAWGLSPRRTIVKRSEPTKWATANGCRPFHGLDIAPNLTRGSTFGSTPGFMLPPAPRAWKNTKNSVSRVFMPFVFRFALLVVIFRQINLLCPHSGFANPECGRSLINRPLTSSRNPFILSPFHCGTHWHGDWLSAG